MLDEAVQLCAVMNESVFIHHLGLLRQTDSKVIIISFPRIILSFHLAVVEDPNPMFLLMNQENLC